jgi:cobalt-zinc-cadmium efflux system outer membrane protein
MDFPAHVRGGRRGGSAEKSSPKAVAGALGLLLFGVAGCAIRDYSPPLLPTFMREDTPASVPPASEVSPATVRGNQQACAVPPAIAKPLTQGTTAVAASKRPAPPVAYEESEVQAPDRPAATSPPSPAAPLVLTLDQAILETLRADPKLRALLEIINQAKDDLLTSSLLPDPTLMGDGVLLPLRRFTVDKQGGPPQTDWTVGFPIDWFLFGKRAAAVESARLGVDVSAADYADQVRQRVAAVIAAFYDVLEARALLDLARQDLDALKRVESITADRVKAGGAGTVELDRAHLSVLDAQREVRNREVALAAAKSALRAFLGPVGNDPALDVVGSLEVVAPASPPSAEEVLAIAEQTRPDIISLKRQIAKAGAAVYAEKTKGCPTVSPTFALTRQFQSSIGFPDAPSWNVSATVSIPLFDRNQGNVAKARSAEAQTALNLQSQLNDLRAEVEQAVDAFRVAHANVTVNDPEELRTARSVQEKIEAGYKAGRRTLLEVLDAERAYRDAYRTYIGGQSAYWHSLYKLNAAAGKQVLR